jgi:ATP-dependent helicase HrpA
VANTVDVIINEMAKAKGSLISSLGKFIFDRFGIDIPASAWPDHLLPDHLKMRISITDPKGEELYSSRDPSILRRNITAKADEDGSDEIESARKKWEKTGIKSWDFPDLPEIISIKGKNLTKWLVYPGLEIGDQDNKNVNLRLFRRQDQAVQSHKDGVAMLFSIYFLKDLKFLKKALIIPKKSREIADYFGGTARFEERLYKKIIKDLFYKNIRSKDAFYSHAESIATKILANGRELMDKSMKVLEAYHETRSIFFHLETENKANAVAIEFLEGLREELARLVPETFMDIYGLDRLVHLERYIKALAIRAQRALVNFEKDRTKAKEIRFFTDSLDELLKGLSPDASEEKRKAVEEYFWLIEEYKVSVFAQELKTPVRVSKKRLEMKLKEIERII